MPFGDYVLKHWTEQKKPIKAWKWYANTFGIPEFHSHLRWINVQKYLPSSAEKVYEVGAGWCLMTVEILKTKPGFAKSTFVTSEYADMEVAETKDLLSKLQINQITIKQSSAEQLKEPTNEYDLVLAIDVLEHVPDTQKASNELARILKPGGTLIVSVPTTHYVKVFGERFNKEIGHLRLYTDQTIIEQLNKSGLKVVNIDRHTGIGAAIGCYIYYRYLYNSLKNSTIAFPILKLLYFTEAILGRVYSSSIILKATK